jgi:hypothetical protein
MKKRYVLAGLLLLGSLASRAQQCGSDLVHQQQLRSNPAYAAGFSRSTQQWQQHQAALKASKRIITGSDTTYEVPVVFHILHSGEAEGTYFNPSAGAIDSLVDYLNKSWAATWPMFPGPGAGGVRMPLQFKLAQRDPDCNPTTGIVRVDASVLPNYTMYGVNLDNTTPAPSDSAVKSLSKWPSGDYYNIWIVNYIDGPSGATAAAYAYYPFPTNLDGTVIAVGYVYPLPSIGTYYVALPHELGHAYYLMHTFEGDMGGTMCPADTDCSMDGDGVCDTEPHIRMNGTCPSGTNACTGLPYNNIQYNIMNYSSCGDRFTPMQRERVIMAMENMRTGLSTSLGATAPDPAFVAPKAACKPGIDFSDNQKNAGPNEVLFADITASSYGYASDNYAAYMDRTCLQQAHLIKGKTYPISVTTFSMEMDIQNVRVWIDYNNNGVFEMSELVFSHNGTTYYESHDGSVKVPATGVVVDKPLRMRVLADVDGAPFTPCDNLQFGQAEDYTVIISSDPTAIADPAARYNIEVAPNPATNTVSVQAAYPVNVAVCGMDGRVLLQQSNHTAINVGGLADGLYILRITDAADGRLIKNEKLVKAAR